MEDFGFPGCCAILKDLIPDPGNKNLWQARPASVQLASLGSATGFASTSFVSGLIVVGNRVYGMAASSTFSGFDAPFCYDLLTGSFVSISGITGGNTPSNASSSYAAWTPPQLIPVGTYIVITHPGYDGVTNFFGWINISNPSSLSYAAGNCTVNPLPFKPQGVGQFNGRAMFMVNPATGQPGVYGTDSLNPLARTTGAYILTFGDNTPLTGFGYIGLQSPLTGGIIQTLLVFKDDSNIFQITGDFASTINQNTLNVPTGTPAPNTVCNSPQGVFFMSPDGIRIINLNGNVSAPIGYAGQGVCLPFIYAQTPSRAAAAATASVYRISVKNGLAAGAPIQEYWYDINLQRWSGPHSFPASLISPWQNTFIMTPQGVPGSLWRSDVQQSSGSAYTENGNPLTWKFQTALFADNQQLARTALNEGFIRVSGFPGMAQPNAYLLDQNSAILAQALLYPGSGGVTVWDGFTWGAALWAGYASGIIQNPLQWSSHITVNEVALLVTGASGAGFKIGDIQARAEITGFMPGIP